MPLMTTPSIVTVLVLLCASSFLSENLPEEDRAGHLWHTVRHKLLKQVNIDGRRFNREDMLLFPDVAFQSLSDNQTWKVVVHGWRYQNSRRKDWLGFSVSTWLERFARNVINQDDILYLNGSINRDRLRPFFATDRSNEMITITIGTGTHEVKTDSNGEFYEQIEIANDEIQKLRPEPTKTVLRYEAVADDQSNATGSIQLIEPSEGLSVISDIDDTIKISEVLDRVRLLANTFISPFKPVSGMPDLYRQWQAKNPHCTFHYLSGMPDQLYTLTQEFIDTNKFPNGSFHMRHFHWAAMSLFDFLHSESTSIHKLRYLRFFLSNTKRDYVLIGDSGEKDPEIYGTVAREHPTRIRAIFIRAIKNESLVDRRFLNAFESIPREKWLVFNDPKQVPVDLSRAPGAVAG